MNSESDAAYFDLGKEKIKVINDGGLGIRYCNGRRYVRWQPRPPPKDTRPGQKEKRETVSARAVLSFEVSSDSTS